MWNSWLPTGYLASWVFNTLIYLNVLIAWWVGGEYFIDWAMVGLWVGVFTGAFPWICMLVYIGYEYPVRFSGEKWQFIFWSAEWFMFFMQGLLWLVSLMVHLIMVPRLRAWLNANYAISQGLSNVCRCDPCELPDDSFERAQAEMICRAACNQKCPPPPQPCPLK